MQIKSVNIIGFGNAGQAIAKQLIANGCAINAVLLKSNTRLKIAAELKLLVYEDIQALPEADLCIICVNDGEVEAVAKHLTNSKRVVHISGTTPIDKLSGILHYGVLYPLQTFSEGRLVEMKNIPFIIDANSESFNAELVQFASEYLSPNIHKLDDHQRRVLHLAAVFANNFSNYMLLVAGDLLREEQISFDILKPLMVETINKVFDLGAEKSQTGPARRKDYDTIKSHLVMLGDEDLKKLYTLISDQIMKK